MKENVVVSELSSAFQTRKAVLTKKKSSNPPLAQEGGLLESAPEG